MDEGQPLSATHVTRSVRRPADGRSEQRQLAYNPAQTLVGVRSLSKSSRDVKAWVLDRQTAFLAKSAKSFTFLFVAFRFSRALLFC
jgi:hypothetical protein